jgi:hypothetical protein
MYDILFIIILILIFFNKDIYEKFNNDENICHINNQNYSLCEENLERIKLLEEKLKLEELQSPLSKQAELKQFDDNQGLYREYNKKLLEIEEKIRSINTKLKLIDDNTDEGKKELLEKINDTDLSNEKVYQKVTEIDEINANVENNKYIAVNKLINIFILGFLSIIGIYLLYDFSVYFFRKLKVKEFMVDNLSINYDNIRDHLKIEKLKKKYKINT